MDGYEGGGGVLRMEERQHESESRQQVGTGLLSTRFPSRLDGWTTSQGRVARRLNRSKQRRDTLGNLSTVSS